MGFSIRWAIVGAAAIMALLMAGAALNAEPPPGSAAVPPSLDGIALALPGAAAVTVPSAPDAWGGARTGIEPTLSDRVVDYRIAATLDPVRHTVTGRQQLTWRNRSKVAVRSIYLHLYMNAFESGDSTFFTEMRLRATGFRSGGLGVREGEWGHIALKSVTQGGSRVPWWFVHPDNGPALDHTVVRFDLPQAVAPGASTTIDTDFVTQLPRVVARAGYFGSFHLVGQWFPKIGVLELPGERGATAPRWNVHEYHLNSEFYADFGNYDVRLTVPKGYTVGATGELQGAPVEKDGMVTHHYVQGDVHDFAWTADNRSAPPLEDTWTGPGSPLVAIRVIYPPEYAASAAPTMKAAKDSLAYFSKTLGPYPYRTLTVVIPPLNASEASGMEYPTFFTADGFGEVRPGTLSQYMLDITTIHEFGHGYFYGILASNEFEEPMLDEGVNQYWEGRLLRERGQLIYATSSKLAAIGVAPRLTDFELSRMAAPRDAPADAPGQNAYDRLQGIGPIYMRTATVLHDLEARIGKDAFEAAFKEYYRRWKFRHPSVADLREALAQASGQRATVEDFFARQMYRAEKVDDRVAEITSVEELPQPGTGEAGGKWIEQGGKALDERIDAQRKQWKKAHPDAKPGMGPFPFRTTVTLRRSGAPVPQTLVVKFADGSSETVRWDMDEKWHRFSWVRPARAVSAELDPQRIHYLDVSKLDDSRTLAADHRPALRWTSDYAALFQLILSLIATV